MRPYGYELWMDWSIFDTTIEGIQASIENWRFQIDSFRNQQTKKEYQPRPTKRKTELSQTEQQHRDRAYWRWFGRSLLLCL